MAWLRRNAPPEYNYSISHVENFDEFYEWTQSLKNPFKQLPEIGAELGFGMRVHPIGFTALYLSERDTGIHTLPRQTRGGRPLTGCARINIYPPGAVFQEDIHCHGFDFKSGVVTGTLINTMHYPDFSGGAAIPEGEGYIGYETTVDSLGTNHTVQATDATVAVPRSEAIELNPGETYSLRPRIDFHSVAATEDGAITFFSKTRTRTGWDGSTLMLKKPDQAPPPATY